tara:strand:+ start:860 stop:1459 length:600 start_codon:yes stop_codon:yes gene_type:complete
MSKTTIPTGGLADAAVTTAKITDANITTAKIADDAVTAAKSTGLGISQAQVWRLTSNFTGDATPISSNLEAADTNSPGAIGSAMTQSSGIFTFPSTGIYLVTAHGEFFYNGDSRYNQLIIEVTTNNSSYAEAAKTSAGIAVAESTHTYGNNSNQVLIDVTDTSNVKVRFTSSVSDDSTSTAGASSYNRTHFSFIRLGDT